MNPLSFIFQAIASFFSWAAKRSDERNKPDMKQAKLAQIDADFQNTAEKAVARKDTDEVRKMLAD